MIQICYISTARPSVTWATVDDIMKQSVRNNSAVRVTGLLLFNGKRFLQVLEGDTVAVETAYGRITADPRHFALVKLSERPIQAREFGDWAMSFERFASERPRMLDQIKQLTGAASPNIRALFNSYAAI